MNTRQTMQQFEDKRGHRSGSVRTWLAALLLAGGSWSAQAGDMCATVQIQIQQELTLERQAFDAHMKIHNGLTTLPMESVRVSLSFADMEGRTVTATSDGNNTNALFYVRLDTMQGINDVSGAGAVAVASDAEIHWLIIPAAGAGGTGIGKRYLVGATLSYALGGTAESITVTPDAITVTPMPKLRLDYFLPDWVYGDDPFTPGIERAEPFSLGVRVKNTGYGVANNVGISSGQPKILDNKRGLLVGYQITAAEVNGVPVGETLAVTFGSIASDSAAVGRWIMECTLSGRFTAFDATYAHSDDLGGRVTSLIDEVRTHTLLQMVRLDSPGSDNQTDFLALDGSQVNFYGSDGTDAPVQNVSALTTLEPVTTGGEATVVRMILPGGNGLLYAEVPFEAGATLEVTCATRWDGKTIHPDNVWISRQRQEGGHDWVYLIHLFDSGSGGPYTLEFAPKSIAESEAPVLQYIGSKTVQIGEQLGFLVQASDADETIPSLTAHGLPAGAAFEDHGDGTGSFMWQTGSGDYGVYSVRFVASDGQSEDEETIRIYVGRSQAVPMIGATNVNVREAGEGRFFVKLDGQPAGDVLVNVSRSAGDTNLAVKSGSVLRFKPTNWNAWQAVTLAAGADANATNETATFRISAPGGADQFIEATALDGDIGANLALASCGATISGTKATKPDWLIDGVHTSSANYGYTTWTNPASPGTMTLDLQAAATVSRIRLLNWDWSHRAHQYQIESSLDGAAWSLLVDAGEGEHRGWEDWAVDAASIRYLRFTGLSNSANAFVCIAEWEVYGEHDPEGASLLEVSRTNVNVREAGEGRFYVRLNRKPEGNLQVSASRSAGDASLSVKSGASLTFTPANWNTWQLVTLAAAADENAIGETATFRISAPGGADQFIEATALDGDIGANLALASGGAKVSGTKATKPDWLIDGVHISSANYGYTTWTNLASPGTITLDLQAATAVSRIRLLNWDWGYRTHRYRIEGSLNGSAWSMLVDADTDRQRGWEEWTLEDEQIRYLRFTGLSNSANQYVCVAEFEVYGAAVPLPQIEVSTENVNVRESGEGRFYVRLASAPLANVAVGVSRSAGDASLSVKGGAALTFTPANWNAWQMVTLAAAADENADDETATFRLSGPGVETRTVSATALDADIGTNWALASRGSTIAGSRNGSTKPEWLIDGIHSSSGNYGYTFWTNDPPGTMTLDLQEATTVSRIRLLNWDWGYRSHQYQIESSLDGADWSLLVDAAAGEHRGWEDWAVADLSIRYLRFTGLSNSANRYVCIAEWEVHGERTAEQSSPAPAKAGIAAVESEPVTVLTSDDVAPDYESGWAALDGDQETAWVGQKVGGGYILVGYAPTLTLKALDVDLAEGSLASIECLYSQDGEEWAPLPEDMEKNPISLNYLWLVFSDDGSQAVPEVFEIRPNP